jgi:hypothetical protein
MIAARSLSMMRTGGGSAATAPRAPRSGSKPGRRGVHEARRRHAVADRRDQPIASRPRRQRDRHRAGAQRPEVGRHQIDGVVDGENDAIAALDATLPEQPGEAVRLGVEVGVGDPARRLEDGDRLGTPRRAGRQELVHQHRRRAHRRR